MSDAARTGHLLRVLGLAFGLAVVVGGVVGQGILRTPGIVANAVSDPFWIMALWTAGGLLLLIDACAMVELGSSMPKAGGPYVYARRAFGTAVGNVVGWADWLTTALVLSFISVVFGEYCHRLGIAADWPIGILSFALILACVALNWTGTKVSGAAQTMLSAAKGIGLIALVIALLLFRGDPEPAAASAASSISPVLATSAMLVALSAILNTYGGWNGSVYFGEEMVDASRNIARSTFGGILLVMALYLSVNAALLYVLSPAEMAGSELPVADAAGRVFGSGGATLVTIASLVSLAAIANLNVMFNSRIGYAMARDAVLPQIFARTSRGGTPQAAILIGSGVAAAAALTGTYLELVAVVVPLTVVILICVNLASIILRRRDPGLPRPFRMPLFPLPAVAGLLLNTVLLTAMIVDDPTHSLLGIGAAVVLGVAYAIFGNGHAAVPAVEAAAE